jgi:hypothetical protein
MKPPVSSLARGQGLFFAWVTLSEHKWVTSRERRRRLAKAGKIQLMGGGRYSTVTQEVKDKERKVKNSHLSLTQTVTVGVAGTLPLQPDKTMEELATRPPTEDTLRQLGLTFSSVPTDHAVGQLGFDSSISTTDHAVRQPV